MAGVKISQLQDGGALQPTDAFPVARGSFTRKIAGSELLTPANFNVADSPTIDLDWNASTRTLSADISTAVKEASAFNVVDSPTIDLNWNASTRTLSADAKNVVAKSGDVMTGSLTVPSLYVNAGSLGGVEGGEFQLSRPQTTSLAGNVTVDINSNSIRFFEGGGSARGAYLNLTQCRSGAGTDLLASGAKAWVNFNGGNGVIRKAYNVSSVSRTSAQDYIVYFSTPMLNGNYCVVTGSSGHNGAKYNLVVVTPTASYVSLRGSYTGDSDGGALSNLETAWNYIAVFE